MDTDEVGFQFIGIAEVWETKIEKVQTKKDWLNSFKSYCPKLDHHQKDTAKATKSVH